MKKVLDIGSGKTNRLTDDYKDFQRVTLDINPNNKPDICEDLRTLLLRSDLANSFDAVFASHVLEHFDYIDILKVLCNIKYIMKKDAWFEILVPNILEVMKFVSSENFDLDSILYKVEDRGVRVIDVLYGLGNTSSITRFENNYMGHKYGFSRSTLVKTLHKADFSIVDDYSIDGNFEIRMVAYL